MYIFAGVKLCDVYQAGVEFVEDRRPDLKGHMVKNFGLVVFQSRFL